MYYMWSRYSSIYVYICTPNIFLYTVYIIKLKGKKLFFKSCVLGVLILQRE